MAAAPAPPGGRRARARCGRGREGEVRRVDRVRAAVPGVRDRGARAAAAALGRRRAPARERRALPARRADRRVSAAREVLGRVRDPRGARGRRAARDAAQHRRARGRSRCGDPRAGSCASAPIPQRSRAGCGACAQRSPGAAAPRPIRNRARDALARGDRLDARCSTASDPTTPLAIPKPEGARPAEVVGIPLGRAGLLRRRAREPPARRIALGRDAPRYVATSALVTDLAVHLQVGPRELARVGHAPGGREAGRGRARRWSATTAPAASSGAARPVEDGVAAIGESFGEPHGLRRLRRVVAPSADRDRGRHPPSDDLRPIQLRAVELGQGHRTRTRSGSRPDQRSARGSPTRCSTGRSSARARPSR